MLEWIVFKQKGPESGGREVRDRESQDTVARNNSS